MTRKKSELMLSEIEFSLKVCALASLMIISVIVNSQKKVDPIAQNNKKNNMVTVYTKIQQASLK